MTNVVQELTPFADAHTRLVVRQALQQLWERLEAEEDAEDDN